MPTKNIAYIFTLIFSWVSTMVIIMVIVLIWYVHSAQFIHVLRH